MTRPQREHKKKDEDKINADFRELNTIDNISLC